MILAVLMLLISRARPLFPVQFSCDLIGRLVSNRFAEKARNAFLFSQGIRQNIDSFHSALPPETKNAGYMTRDGGIFAIALWKPFGSRKVWRFFPTDSHSTMLRRQVEYVIEESDAIRASGVMTIDDWLKMYPGKIIFENTMAPEPDSLPDSVYLVKLERQP